MQFDTFGTEIKIIIQILLERVNKKILLIVVPVQAHAWQTTNLQRFANAQQQLNQEYAYLNALRAHYYNLNPIVPPTIIVPPQPQPPTITIVPPIQGSNGLPGVSVQGNVGANGVPSASVQGNVGANGVSGANGLSVQGVPGVNVQGNVGNNGLSANGVTVHGSNGANGANGPNVNGANGISANGQNGVNGQSSSSVIV